MDATNKRVDSVLVTATALPAVSPGWHRSGCSLQGSSSVGAFCKLSTGRLFTCYPGAQTYLRYSDDNGVNWFPVKSLGNNHSNTYVISSPSDEIFVFTWGDGTFYSKDAGVTWSNSGAPPFDPQLISSAVCTTGGKLLVTAPQPSVCLSLDKGKTWTTTPPSVFLTSNMNNPVLNNPTEDKDGNIYVAEQQNKTIFKSADAGKTWLPFEQGGTDFSFYIDNNNWFYKSVTELYAGIYVSKDKGVTYAPIITYPDLFLENMSVQSDGNFYYEDIERGLYYFDEVSKTGKKIFPFSTTGVQPFIVAKNNNVIVSNLGNGYIKYYTK